MVRPGEYVIGRWRAVSDPVTPTVATEGQAWPIEFGFIGVTREGREVRFRPVVEAAGGLLSAIDAAGFKGSIFVGLQDLNDPAARYDLPRPISLLVTAPASEVSPRQFEIGHTSLPFTEIALVAPDPPDALSVTVQASGTSERATIDIPVTRPRLELSFARSWIQGFGLEATDVTVRSVGLNNPAGRVVTFSSDFGSVDPSRVTLDEQGIGTTTLRSVSLGQGSVSTSSPPLSAASGMVQFGWPIGFLVAATLGGVAGALLGRARATGRRKRHTAAAAVGIGVLTGLVTVALFAVGVNVLPIQPTATAGEALTFALAAVGAFTGLRFR
jgi:hypothetical protein